MNNLSDFSNNRGTITRAVLGYCLFWLFFRYLSFTFPSHLENPVLVKTNYELFYVLMKGTGLAQFLGSNMIAAWVFNLLLFGSGLALYLFPKKQLMAIIFSIMLFLLYSYSNLYVTHSMHYLPLMSLAMLAFIPRNNKTFSLLWEGLRYIACWAYFSTFAFKMIFGAMWQWDYGMLIFKSNVANYILLNPDSFFTEVYTWFIQHPAWLNVGQKLVFILEGIFLVGFFTRKYDLLLIVCSLLIFLSTTLFVEVFFIEQLGIITFLLLKPKDWSALRSYFFKGLSGSFAK